MSILITGAGGFVGQSLVKALRSEGNQILTLARGKTVARPGCFLGPNDLADIEHWPGWPNGVRVIVHLAALNPKRADRQSSGLALLRHVNVEGTAALTRRARREGVERMIFLSSANVYSSDDGKMLSALDCPPLRNAYGISKMEAEHAFWESLGGNMKGCVLRPAPVYGPGGSGNVATLIALAKTRWPLPLGHLGGPRSLIAIDHLVDAIRVCIRSPAASGQIFNVADDGPLTLGEFVHAFRSGLGRRAMVVPAPSAIFQTLARIAGKDALWQNAMRSFVLDTGHIRMTLGWRSAMNTQQKVFEMAAAGIF